MLSVRQRLAMSEICHHRGNLFALGENLLRAVLSVRISAL